MITPFQASFLLILLALTVSQVAVSFIHLGFSETDFGWLHNFADILVWSFKLSPGKDGEDV